MIYGSVCSGIEAATMAWHPLGWRPAFFSEIDPFPSAVLAHHYPQVPNLGDMTRFKEWPDAAIDLLVGGTPCQSFSVAGLRKGLDDPRGSLMLTYLAIARRYRPRWLVWENVPGVLSADGGRAFGTLLGGMAELGYGFAYRVLDAQYVRTLGLPFAVPQRRRRVFVVGHIGDWRRAAAVLFDRESLSGNSPPRRETGKGVAPTIAARTRGGGGLGTDFDCDGGLIANSGEVGYCLTRSGQQSLDAETLIAVAHALRGEGFDASEDGTGRGTPIVPIAIQERAMSENPDAGPDGVGVRQDGAAYTLEARTVPQAVAFDGKGSQVQHDDSGSSPTLRAMGSSASHANGGGQLAVAFDLRGREGGAMPEGPHDTANLRAASGGSSRSYVAFAESSRAEIRLVGGDGSVMSQLTTGGGKPGQGQPVIALPWAVRRLTPRECERLQGFPDDFTLIPWRRGMSPDGPRYKALGNSMAVNVMQWIGERIEAVEATP